MPGGDGSGIGDRGKAGFTLLEVLVAFAIAAIALSVLLRGGVDSLSAARLAGRYDEAVSRARSRLDAMCHGARLAPQTLSGDDGGGYRWRVEVRPRESTVLQFGNDPDNAGASPPLRATLFAVAVAISWSAGARPREVLLDTQCLAFAPVRR